MRKNNLCLTKSNSKIGWYSRGYLPHFKDDSTPQFITFRLADSIPESVFLAAQKGNKKAYHRYLEKYLDNLHGSLILQRSEVASIVRDALFFYNNKKYRIIAWVIMPNHVHILVEPNPNFDLLEAIGLVKSFTSKEINKLIGSKGRLWERESFDRYIRNEYHFFDCIEYIEQNPVKSKLVKVAEEWMFSSAYKNFAQ